MFRDKILISCYIFTDFKEVMRIALAQLNYHVGNFSQNLSKMLDAVARARTEGADLICFSELATCGYFPKDFLELKNFIKLCEKSIHSLAEVSHDIRIVVGSPTVNPDPEGKDLYNSA
jgi:NAD+ synthase (glutamine-hydrolysing)